MSLATAHRGDESQFVAIVQHPVGLGEGVMDGEAQDGAHGGDPGMMMPMVLGAVIGRFYMIKRYGLKRWYMFNPVLAAGFFYGVGLIGMGTVAIALVSKSVIVKPF